MARWAPFSGAIRPRNNRYPPSPLTHRDAVGVEAMVDHRRDVDELLSGVAGLVVGDGHDRRVGLDGAVDAGQLRAREGPVVGGHDRHARGGRTVQRPRQGVVVDHVAALGRQPLVAGEHVVELDGGGADDRRVVGATMPAAWHRAGRTVDGEEPHVVAGPVEAHGRAGRRRSRCRRSRPVGWSPTGEPAGRCAGVGRRVELASGVMDRLFLGGRWRTCRVPRSGRFNLTHCGWFSDGSRRSRRRCRRLPTPYAAPGPP